MSLKKPAVLLAGVGTCALALASCSSPASQAPAAQSDPAALSGADAQSPQSTPPPASSLPTGDTDTALTSKSGQSSQSAPSAPAVDTDPARPAVIIVRLEEDADHEATLAAINEAVAGVYPGASVTVEREYKNALQGFALRAPAGSLEAIRGVSGVSAAFLERETYVQ